jgi:hypothetical protein
MRHRIPHDHDPLEFGGWDGKRDTLKSYLLRRCGNFRLANPNGKFGLLFRKNGWSGFSADLHLHRLIAQLKLWAGRIRTYDSPYARLDIRTD